MKGLYKNLLISIVTLCYAIGTFSIITMPEHMAIYLSVFAIAIIGTVAICIINKKEITNFMQSNLGKNISSNFVGFILLFFILGLVNYIAFKRPLVLDLGKRNLNSLTEQSLNIVKEVNDEVSFTIFSNRANRDPIRNLIKLYQNENKKIVINYVDPELRPDLVAASNVTVSPSVVVRKGEKKFTVTKMQELSFTNALINIQRQRQPVLCFNYQKAFEKTDEGGLTGFLHILKSAAFELKIINILQVGEIPRACDVFTIWGLQSDFLPENMKKITDYYNGGGTLVTALAPMFNGDKILNFRKFLIGEGLSINNDIVIDKKLSVSGSKGSAPLIKKFDSQGINTRLDGQVFFPLTSSVHNSGQNQSMKFVALASSSKDSWSERTILEMFTDEIKMDDKDIPGPIDVAGAVLDGSRPRIIGLGNSSLVTNKFYNFQSNFNFVLNIFHWSVGQDMLTSVQAAVFEEKPIFIGATGRKVIFYFSVIASPLVFILLALVQYRRRRIA